MKLAEITGLTLEEIVQKLEETRLDLGQLRMKLAARQLDDTSQVKKKRKTIARLLTVMTIKEKGGESIPKAEKEEKTDKKKKVEKALKPKKEKDEDKEEKKKSKKVSKKDKDSK